ncbi:MAG TPA: hypothetical protein PKC59_03595 [Burkholderiaceae bacterium]|nr:hypothetical protein [Burkholderiaceae bacterium]HMX10717.1 hypothetical protein [Burkholderiaceae bacterium]HMZ00758.1 hypothetical protein [Burkholderiaceae bacterium]HNB45417.1 hypothetical protein [Burkholderiaceae bacterium]HNG81323.1 hypothetical protein [Burkholderiaceae bacterium]
MAHLTNLLLSAAGALLGCKIAAVLRSSLVADDDRVEHQDFQDTIRLDMLSQLSSVIPGSGRRAQGSERQVPLLTLPEPQACIARWQVDYASHESEVHNETVRVLQVHPRLMCLTCYVEFCRGIRALSWSGIKAVRDAQTGQPIDFDAWIAAYALEPAAEGDAAVQTLTWAAA